MRKQQLKSTISFFTLDTSRQRLLAAPRSVASRPHAKSLPVVAAKPAKQARNKREVAVSLDLDMNGGADHLDDAFEKY